LMGPNVSMIEMLDVSTEDRNAPSASACPVPGP
jgi:hypothetical protein